MSTAKKIKAGDDPNQVREQAGLSSGDLFAFSYERGRIVTPKLVMDRSKFPATDGEYTPAQRRAVDAQLREALKGRTHGPFDTADEMIAHIKGELRKRSAAKKPSAPDEDRVQGARPEGLGERASGGA